MVSMGSSVVSDTNYKCRGCNSTVRKLVDSTPENFVGKYLCKCINSSGESTGPQFPIYKNE